MDQVVHTEELDFLIIRAQAGDLDAFGTIVMRFQDMAVGYAYSILGDFHLAQDAAQEAFIEAYRNIAKVYDAVVFPAWFRRIIFKNCDRFTRREHNQTVELDQAVPLPSTESDPQEIVEDTEMKQMVLSAILSLPEDERTVTTLFYINGYTYNEISTFLEIPKTAIDNHLRSARKRLKKKMVTMVGDMFHEEKPSKSGNFANRVQFFNAVEDGDMDKVKEYYKEAKFNNGAILEIASMVPKAKYNIPVITHTAYLVSKFGYHTLPLENIAKMASSCDHECPELSDIADLIVMTLSKADKVMQIAESAVKAKTEVEKKQIKQRIDKFKSNADYKDIEEALKAQQQRESQNLTQNLIPFDFSQKMDTPEKQEAIRAIEVYYKKAREQGFHDGGVSAVASMVPTAKHNLPVIVHIAYLVQSFGYNTKPLIDIAKIASASNQEYPELSDIADIVVMKTSGTFKIDQLVESAIKAQSDEEKNEIKQKIEELRATADYKTIEEALEGQKQGQNEQNIVNRRVLS